MSTKKLLLYGGAGFAIWYFFLGGKQKLSGTSGLGATGPWATYPTLGPYAQYFQG